MKPHFLFFLFLSICLGFNSPAQNLVIDHLNILVDTIPFHFSGSPITKNYSRYREIRIGCVNTGKKDLIFIGAKQCFTNDTSWLKASDNVKFPALLKPGVYGEISIIYSVSSPFQRFQILSNSKTGPQAITLLDTYREQVEIKRNMNEYPAKLQEGDVANFSSLIVNYKDKRIILDSVAIPDPSLKLITKLPFSIDPGKSAPLLLMAGTSGKMNYYYGGTPVFFYHPENEFEDFVKQEFSCIIVPNVKSLGKDTFDFGSVKRGTIISSTFHFVNNGSFKLETGKNKSSCMTYDKSEVAPGENFNVTIKYNTTIADSGKTTMEFPILLPPFFYSNSVFLSGEVKGQGIKKSEVLMTDQRIINCGKISNDTAKTIKRSIRIKNNSPLPINISNVTITEGAYAFCDTHASIAPGEYFILKFAYNTKNPGSFDKVIVLSLTSGECSNGEFAYSIEVKGEVISK